MTIIFSKILSHEFVCKQNENDFFEYIKNTIGEKDQATAKRNTHRWTNCTKIDKPIFICYFLCNAPNCKVRYNAKVFNAENKNLRLDINKTGEHSHETDNNTIYSWTHSSREAQNMMKDCFKQKIGSVQTYETVLETHASNAPTLAATKMAHSRTNANPYDKHFFDNIEAMKNVFDLALDHPDMAGYIQVRTLYAYTYISF